VSREDAISDLARSKWWDADEHGNTAWRVPTRLREAVTARFGTLELEQQRDLVRSILAIKVHPGRAGKEFKRAEITPLVPLEAVPA
jgi:hypothetical protein